MVPQLLLLLLVKVMILWAWLLFQVKYSIRVLNENGEGDSFTVAKGIVTAVDQGADIINLSLGGFGSSSVMDNAIEYAKSKNVLLVSAVGNDGTQAVSYPASHNDVVAVTSVDANARVSSFSNFGPEVDISAPGVGIFTAWEDNEFVQTSGTSIATAFVTGALASEPQCSPSLNKTEVLNALYTNADETENSGKDIWSGRGCVKYGQSGAKGYSRHNRCCGGGVLFRS